MPYQIDQALCSCCHRCRVLCPVQAIRFKNAKYWIDSELCIDCGLCAKNCHNGVISQIGAEPAAPVPHDPIRLDVDLAVVGGGGAGLICAVKYVMLTGGTAVVLEKNHEVGGNTWYASGFMAHYSALQKAAGQPDTREEQIRQFMLETLQKGDPALIRNVYYGTERFLDWLMQECSCEEDFEIADTPFGSIASFQNHSGTKYPRIDCSIGPGGVGSFLIEKMMEQAKRLGIRILTNCAGKKLMLDEGGAVTGVIAEDEGGGVEVTARTVVMATGCFSHNRELVEQCQPHFFDPDCVPVHRFSVPTCTGDGIAMCREAGAEIDLVNNACLILGPARHPYAFSLVHLIREPMSILVNANGKRFGNEQENTMGMRKVILDQPGRFCWCITNDAILTAEQASSNSGPMSAEEHIEVCSHWKEQLEEELRIGAECAEADTLEELAEKIGVPGKTLVETIRAYNEFCARGHDDDYFKAPEFLMPLEGGPFYALRMQTFQENAVGGCRIDSRLRVLRPDGSVIPNLYAVGDNTRGVRLAGDLEAEIVERNISNLTWCVASGYMAAENAASELERAQG